MTDRSRLWGWYNLYGLMHFVRIPMASTFCKCPLSLCLCLRSKALLLSVSNPPLLWGRRYTTQQRPHSPCTERSHHMSSFCPVPCLSLSLCLCLSWAGFPLCRHSQILLDKPDI